MPLPMVHLKIANEVAKTISIDDRQAFYMGALAPDAIHKRGTITRADKNITHLQVNAYDATDEALEVVVDFLRREMAGACNKDFTLGYGLHIMTDRLWVEQVYRPFKALLKPYLGKLTMTRRYYTDTAYVDNLLFEDGQDLEGIMKLFNARQVYGNAYVYEEEVKLWLQQVKVWMTGRHTSHMTEAKYIDYETIKAFVPGCSHQLSQVLSTCL